LKNPTPGFRFSFLPTFFVALTIAFVIAAAVRIHSFNAAPPDHRVTLRHVDAEPARTPSSPVASIGDASMPSENSGTIEPVQSEADQRRIAEREQRYKELLQSPPPAAPGTGAVSAPGQPNGGQVVTRTTAAASTKPPVQPPSLLSRIGNAIARAVGAGPSSSSMGSSQQPTQRVETPREKEPVKEQVKDPNSDTTPPVLGTIEFIPQLVHDGEETTLAITASDDISGVRTISGNVVSPSGALQGFALQREGETPRFLTRLMVPKDAAEGVWHVNYLNLTDNASNSVTLSYAQGMLPATAAFRVQSSRSDTTPPSLKAVWLDRPQIKAGEKGTIFVTAEDDKSGVNLVSGVFISPSKFARVGFGCRQQNESTTWACDIMPPSTVECNDWQLEQVQLQDKANNMTAVRSDNPMIANVKLNIMSDACDSHPPTVQTVMLDNTRVGSPSVINVSVQANDDNSGVASVSGHFVYTGAVAPGSQPPRLYFSCRATGEAPAITWIGPLPIPDKAAKGVWKLGALQVLDKANNLKLYSQNDPVVANVQFTVQ